MFSFLKNMRSKDLDSKEVKEQVKDLLKEESVLSVNEAPINIDESAHKEAAAANQTKLHATELSLHEAWEKLLDTPQKYSFSFMASELPPIEEGNISLAGIALTPHEDGIEIAAFVRNGTAQPVRLTPMNLVVLIKDNELFARQSFDLSEIGEIPPFTARPWTFLFTREHFLQVDVLLEKWKLAFELAEKKLVLPQQLELEESWIKALSDDQKDKLIHLAKQLPPLNSGEVNVQSVQLSKSDDGSLRAMLLFRNGSDKSLSFEKLPLVLFDAAGDKVAEGLFELGSLIVNPNTSKPWLFIFPPESIVKNNPDFSRWKVNIPQG